MKTSTPQALKAHAMAFNPAIPAQTTAPAATHTPGPWEFRPVIYSHILKANGGRPIRPAGVLVPRKASTGAMDLLLVCGNEREDEANARLIAAAPELLEALQAIVVAAQTGKITAGSNYFTEAASLIGQADAAIAQATL